MTTYNEPRERVDTDQTMVGQAAPTAESGYLERPPYSDEPIFSETRQRKRFGGLNWGAGFFGWLVTVAMAVLLLGGLTAGVAALGGPHDVPGAASSEPRTVGIMVAAILFGVLLVAFSCGGYVAGRMSRFDGGRQGVGVWLIGLLLIGGAVGLALLFGGSHDVLARANLSALPVPTQLSGITGVITAVVALLGSMFAAMAGGMIGCRYHRKVDDAGYL